MTTPSRRRRGVVQTATPPFVVEEWTNHYRYIDGQTYRDAVVRRADGARRLFLIRDDVAAAMAA